MSRYQPAANEGRLDGKVIIVTGSTQGLGEAFAHRCVYLGAQGVVICGRSRAKGEKVLSDLKAIGADAIFVQADLTQEADCRQVVRAADERFGRVDGLVNSAADTSRGMLETTSVELWDRLYNLNVRAPFILMQETARVMRREKIQGSIVNIITMSSYGGDVLQTAYATSKAALVLLTKNVAYQLQPEHIRVNGLNIGWTDTPGEHNLRKSLGEGDDWVDKAYASSPLGRMLLPEDVAPMVTFLLSEMSSMVTGSVMDYDQSVQGPSGPHLPQTG